jgi:S1-C subfamily serine protease
LTPTKTGDKPKERNSEDVRKTNAVLKYILTLSAIRHTQPLAGSKKRGKTRNELYTRLLQRGTRVLLVFVPAFLTFGASAEAGEINACKYLQVLDFSYDPYGIAKELRVEAGKKGFVVVASRNEIPANDILKMCTMGGTWNTYGSGGSLSMQVTDVSGELIAEADARVAARLTIGGTVHAGVGKVYSQFGYTGFNEGVFRQRLLREYPLRPTLRTSEELIKKSELRNHIEGIWADSEDRYRLGVVPAPEGTGVDYVAVVLQSNSPLWQPGEIKAEFHVTATADVFTCTYFMNDKKPVGTTLTLERNSFLRGSPIKTQGEPFNLTLVRVWPSISAETSASGTGFFVTRSGLIATNWHVVADAKNITVAFPNWSGSAPAEVVIRDKVNDLALLRITDPAKQAANCSEPPFQLRSSNNVALGEHVSTIGYPLSSILGSSPKFAEGVVSSKSGVQDDPRTLQISAQVQPGSSGSPLFDNEGNVVGVVVATLDAGKLYQIENALPQNVNFAVKSDYLLSLLAMLPSEVPAPRAAPFSVEKATECVALIHSR